MVVEASLMVNSYCPVFPFHDKSISYSAGLFVDDGLEASAAYDVRVNFSLCMGRRPRRETDGAFNSGLA